MTFSERLIAPWWWWLLGLGITGGAAAELQQGRGTAALYVVLPGLALALLVSLSRQRLRVADGVLHVPGARAPLSAFGTAEVVSGPDLRTWLGPRAQRGAHVQVRQAAHRRPGRGGRCGRRHAVLAGGHPTSWRAAGGPVPLTSPFLPNPAPSCP